MRRELAAYAATVPEDSRTHPENVGIDKRSLRALVSTDSATRRLSLAVAQGAGATLSQIPETILEHDVVILKFLGINTIAELERCAFQYRDLVDRFAHAWLEGKTYEDLHEGIGILYLAYVILAESGDETRIQQFAEAIRLSGREEGALPRRVVAAYRTASA
jgi:hypothetical protein